MVWSGVVLWLGGQLVTAGGSCSCWAFVFTIGMVIGLW